MNRGRRKTYSSFLHAPTGVYRSVVGAREAEAGRVFVTIEQGDSCERLFLVSTFEGNKVEIDALFATLHLKEVARVKAKNRKDVLSARARDARARAASDAEDEQEYESSRRDLSEEAGVEYEPDESPKDFEIIAPADSFGFEPLPEAEAEEIEVFED